MSLRYKINFTSINKVFFQKHPISSLKRFIDFCLVLKEVSIVLTMSFLNK